MSLLLGSFTHTPAQWKLFDLKLPESQGCRTFRGRNLVVEGLDPIEHVAGMHRLGSAPHDKMYDEELGEARKSHLKALQNPPVEQNKEVASGNLTGKKRNRFLRRTEVAENMALDASHS